jgi:hypothetical protein
MDVFAYGKALADMWALGSQTMIAGQEAAAKAVAASMGAAGAPGVMPGMAGFAEIAGDSADLARANTAMMALWSSAMDLSQLLAKRLPTGQTADPTADATFHKMIDPRSWLGSTGDMDDVLSRMSEGARFSDLWDVERKYTRVFRAWLGVRQRGMEHNAVLLAAWQRAAQQFSDALSKKPDAPPADAKAMLRLWTEIANGVLIEAQRSEAFLETQSRMLKASTELRLAQHDLVEYYGERFGFPTRRELDDVHKTVTELKREVRQLRRLAASPPGANAATAPMAKPRAAPARKARG